MKTVYTAHATNIAGREGSARTDDGALSLTLSRPGSGKPGTNPEQLFACGYGACFGSAVQFVAKQEKQELRSLEIETTVALLQDDTQGFSLAVTHNVRLEGVDADIARSLVGKAHGVCPYSKATRGNIDVKLQVDGELVDSGGAAV